MALISDLEVENVLIWNTEIPFENKMRQSSLFSLMGLDWCLRFSYEASINTHIGFPPSATTETVFHAVTLHRVIDGQVVTEDQQRLRETFSIKTYLKHLKGNNETNAKNGRAVNAKVVLWYAGKSADNIFNSLPSLHQSCEVQVFCRFYGRPQSDFQLKVRREIRLPSRPQKPQNHITLKDKSVQASLKFPENMESLSGDICHLLEKGILSDVRLECGNHTFQAHRCVLAARSNVFRAMFENKLVESETGVVKISDIEAAVLKKLLRFIYSGKQGDITEDDAADLYEVADKYGVVSLRQACAYWITRNLRVENCVEYLKVADSHSDCELKDAVVSFIIRNPPLLKSAEWLALSKSSPVLAVEVFQTYIASTVK